MTHYPNTRQFAEQLLNEDEDAEIDLILYSPYPPRSRSMGKKTKTRDAGGWESS